MFDKASIIKAVTQVSIIVIAIIVAALILNVVIKKECSCKPEEIDAAQMPQAIGDFIATNPPASTR